MASIQIQTDVLTRTASELRTINDNMDRNLRNINTTMNELESTWKSTAAGSIRQAMNNLEPRFREYKEVVASYAQFLDFTAGSYEGTEGTANSSATELNKSQFK